MYIVVPVHVGRGRSSISYICDADFSVHAISAIRVIAFLQVHSPPYKDMHECDEMLTQDYCCVDCRSLQQTWKH